MTRAANAFLPARGERAWAAGLVTAFLVVAVAGALLWRQLWQVPQGVVIDHVWYPTSPWAENSRLQFDATAWFVAISLVGGLTLGGVAGVVGRARETVTLAAVTLGSVLAAAVLFLLVVRLAPAEPTAAIAAASDGTEMAGWLVAPGWVARLTFPLGALLPLCVLFLTTAKSLPRDTSARYADAPLSEESR
jgi:hypothetical protein